MVSIPVAQATLGENEKKYVLDCLDLTWIYLDELHLEDLVPAEIRMRYPKTQIATFLGAPWLAQRDTTWMVEFDAKSLADNGQAPQEWQKAFEALGFVKRIVDPQKRQLEQWLQERVCAQAKKTVMFARSVANFRRKAGGL